MRKLLVLVVLAVTIVVVARTAQPPMPNPLLTPGNYNSEVKVYDTLTPSGVQKFAAMSAYGLTTDDLTNYTVLLLVPSEMGGTVTVANMFPVPATQAQVKTNFDALIVQFYINCVATNTVLADQCRADIALNWVQASALYLK